jgi:hypothetical protein
MAVDRRRVRQQQVEFEHVSLDFQLDPRHIGEHRAEPLGEHVRALDRVVGAVQRDRRMLVGHPLDVLGQPP